MIKKLQYYISDCVDPYFNLATEKYLLDTVADDGCILYLWQNKNTVVIGQNQNPWSECRCTLLEAEDGKLARRLSGGGAVFHDLGNLNFTFLCATENYDLVRQMQVIQTACGLAGINTELSGRNDILVDGRKFSGNAFYNAKGKSYHHGTILISANLEKMTRYLTPSKAKLETKGIKSVKSRVMNLSEVSPQLTPKAMIDYMVSAFGDVYGLKAERFGNINCDKVNELTKEYSSWEYLYGFAIPFTFSCEKHFEWGQVNLQLQIKDGIITLAKLYTDSMDWQISELVENALKGCRFTLTDMQNALYSALPEATANDFVCFLKEQNI